MKAAEIRREDVDRFFERGETLPAMHASKTHCPRGHAYDDANTVIHHGSRECRTCNRIRDRKRRAHREK